LKVQLGNKLQASVAVFENTRTNEPVSVGLTSVQEGKTRAAGVDSNLIWQPTPEFSALLNYTFQDARVIRGSTTLKAGNQLARVPEHSARAAIRYDFQSGSLKGLGAGFGLTMASRREGDSGNTFSTGGFAVADAQFSYTRGAATYAVGIENLFDSRFFQPHAFLGGTVAPNQPRTAFAQITFRF
jgi:iron complex outermembrane receptor protein